MCDEGHVYTIRHVRSSIGKHQPTFTHPQKSVITKLSPHQAQMKSINTLLCFTEHKWLFSLTIKTTYLQHTFPSVQVTEKNTLVYFVETKYKNTNLNSYTSCINNWMAQTKKHKHKCVWVPSESPHCCITDWKFESWDTGMISDSLPGVQICTISSLSFSQPTWV